MKGKIALCGLIITALLLGASPALANGPTLPHAFYGTVTIGDYDAPVDSVVSAEVGGVDGGSYTISVAGRYGNLDERDYLLVQGDIANGATITFYVNGIEAEGQTAIFEAGGGPTLLNLSVTIPRPPGAGPGIAPAPPAGTTDVRGQVSDVGVFLSPVTAISDDGLCTLTIPEGTVGLTEELEPLTEITMLIMDEPPPPPENAYIIGLAYDFGPDGATFELEIEEEIILEFPYDPDDLPELVYDEDIGEWVSFDEDYLVLAMWDENVWNEDTGEWGVWVELEDCVVDTENNTITALVEHFTTFAIIARAPAAPPPALAPAAFTSSSLSISPLEVDIGETVSISVLVTNTGEEEGSYTLTLKIDGVVEETKEITLAGGASETVTFTTAKDKAGAYSVGVDGLTGLFTVKEAPPPPAPPPPVPPLPTPPPGVNWTILGPVLGVAVFLAIFLPIRLRRRRAG